MGPALWEVQSAVGRTPEAVNLPFQIPERRQLEGQPTRSHRQVDFSLLEGSARCHRGSPTPGGARRLLLSYCVAGLLLQGFQHRLSEQASVRFEPKMIPS